MRFHVMQMNGGNGKETAEIPEVLSNFLAGNMTLNHLQIQLPMVHDMIKTACDGTSITIRHVTNIRTITDALQQIEMYTNLLSEVNKAVRMYYTFPVTSATAERSLISLN